ncbi:hypothetical protein ACWEPC_45140, partial [Nonomuraea sp. NPDC004297]
PPANARRTAAQLDGSRYVPAKGGHADLDDRVRLDRLTERHVRFGKSPEQAARWVAEVDEPNAVAIRATRASADLRVDIGSLPLSPCPRPASGG